MQSAIEAALSARGFIADASQRMAIQRLNRLHDGWADYKAHRSNALLRWVARPPIPQGVYLWGPVGRGKSMLMDAFFASVPLLRKTRVHFHEFMRAVHRELEDVKGMPEPLDEVARRILRRHRMICFDEFHVSDIADAMLLHRLLLRLFEGRMGFVMTSNVPPSGLYPDGLHRDRIVPAIALLEKQLEVVSVDGGQDYRQLALAQVESYLVPSGPDAEAKLAAAFESLRECADDDPVLRIESRQIQSIRRAGGVVWFQFSELCGGPRSQNDYLELAARFHTVLLSGVPAMSAGQADKARRFTWLVDVMYDHRIRMLLSADVAPSALYKVGALAKEFERTASRLVEMQSRAYMQEPRRPVGGPLS